MRTKIVLATTLLTIPIIAHAAPQQCAIMPSQTMVNAPEEPRIELPKPIQVGGATVPLAPQLGVAALEAEQPASASSAVSSKIGLGGPPPLDAVSSTVLTSAPALAHIAASGASLSDLGMSHGLRTVIASHNGQFMVFEVTPDGQATVAGLMADLTVDQLQATAGKQLVTLAERHGLPAYFLHNGPNFQVFYGTPDGQRLIPGVMWGVTGENITQRQIAAIPGTTPTVTIGKVPDSTLPSPTADMVPSNTMGSLLAVAEQTSYGSVGNESAPQLWMFIDPQCSFSIRAMRELQSYVSGGQVRLNIIPLSILDSEDGGLSTRSALGLVSVGREGMIPAWESGQIPDGSGPEAAAKLGINMRAAAAAQVRGTPTFVWRKPDGSEGRINGLPSDMGAMIAALRS